MIFFYALLVWLVVPNLWLAFALWHCRAERDQVLPADSPGICPVEPSPLRQEGAASLTSAEDLEVAALCCQEPARDSSVFREVPAVPKRSPAFFPPRAGSTRIAQDTDSP
jgi:hypothetical protein